MVTFVYCGWEHSQGTQDASRRATSWKLTALATQCVERDGNLSLPLRASLATESPSPPIVLRAVCTALHLLNYSLEVRVISSWTERTFRVSTVVTGVPCIHSLAFAWNGLNLKETLAIRAMCLAFGWISHPVWYLNRNASRGLSVEKRML